MPDETAGGTGWIKPDAKRGGRSRPAANRAFKPGRSAVAILFLIGVAVLLALLAAPLLGVLLPALLIVLLLGLLLRAALALLLIGHGWFSLVRGVRGRTHQPAAPRGCSRNLPA
jgi:hypothetical protein